jgi:hypothetical protein
MFAFFGLFQCFDQGSAAFFSCPLTECNRPSFLAIVFFHAYVFNGDLNQWDVAEVTTMEISKSICRVEIDLT